jgi:hypothetical protein
MHYLYDLVWFAMPIFLSSPDAFLVDKAIVVVAAALPAALVIYRQHQYGQTTIKDIKDSTDGEDNTDRTSNVHTNEHWFHVQKKEKELAAAAKAHEDLAKAHEDHGADPTAAAAAAHGPSSRRVPASQSLIRSIGVTIPFWVAVWVHNTPFSNETPWLLPVSTAVARCSCLNWHLSLEEYYWDSQCCYG